MTPHKSFEVDLSIVRLARDLPLILSMGMKGSGVQSGRSASFDWIEILVGVLGKGSLSGDEVVW